MSVIHPRIALFCPSLGLGGSEQQLVNLAIGLHARGYDVRVIVLYGGEPLERALSQVRVPVVNLNKKTAIGAFAAVFRLRRYIRRERVHIIYSFHGLPNLLAALTRLVDRHVKIVIGVRATRMDVSGRAWWQRWAYWLEPRLATCADLIIANSHAGHKDAAQRGFPSSKLRVVLNGIDASRFLPDRAAGLRMRRELNIDASARVVGLVARIDPMKGHRTFLEAAAIVKAKEANARFLCVWEGDPLEQQRLTQLSRRLGLGETVLWTRGDRDMGTFYNAMDVAVSASCYGEGFSNTIAEAMACGCQCVVTDAGDSARLVEGLGIIVPPRDSSKLAAGILTALTTPYCKERSMRARERILLRYSVDAMVNGTSDYLLQLMGNPLVSQHI
jgi:glycosyltransferase involved in cell wall biosynthesis